MLLVQIREPGLIIRPGCNLAHQRRISIVCVESFKGCTPVLRDLGGRVSDRSQAERRGDVRNISGDFQRTAYACLVAEVADKVLEERHPVDDVFELVVATIERLNVPERSPRAESVWFVMRILELLGYQPQLVSCASCGEPLPEAACWFSPLLGGALCGRCGAHDQAGSPVSVNGLKVLRVMAAGDGMLYDRLRLKADLLQEVEAALEAQLEYHLDRRLKSLDFIRSIRH